MKVDDDYLWLIWKKHDYKLKWPNQRKLWVNLINGVPNNDRYICDNSYSIVNWSAFLVHYEQLNFLKYVLDIDANSPGGALYIMFENHVRSRPLLKTP